jgi:tetratricopeptide (TPR) repeat protein
MKASIKHPQRYGAYVAVAAALLLAACGSAPVKPDRPDASSTPAANVPDHGDPQARFDAALTQMKAGDAVAAEDAFKSLTTDFPQYAGPWTNLGILYAKAKKRDAAIAALTRATQIDANNVVAFNWLGILNREAGNYAGAKQAYERGLAVKPDDGMTRLNYAILLDQYLKQPQAALEQYKQYQSQSKKEDLRVMAWIAEIEAKNKVDAPPPAAAATAPGSTP